jgi:hypothetical protein
MPVARAGHLVVLELLARDDEVGLLSTCLGSC